MPEAKSNISPQAKTRLRQAILSEIGDSDQGGGSGNIKPSALYQPKDGPKPPLKSAKKVSFKPVLAVSEAPAKTDSVESQDNPAQAAKASPAPKAAAKKTKKVTKKNMPAKDTKAKTAKGGIKKPRKAAAAAKAAPNGRLKAKKSSAKPAAPSQIPAAESPAVSVGAKKIFAPKPFAPTYEAEDVDAIAETKLVSGKPKFGLYQPQFKTKPAKKEESLEKIFSTSPKVIKAKKAAFEKMGEIKPSRKVSWIKIVSGAAIVLAAIAAFDIAGLYFLGFDDTASWQTAKLLNLPAGSVNGKMISLADSMEVRKKLGAAMLKQREGVIDYSGKSDIKEKAFYYLATQKLVEEKLASYGQAVSEKEVDAQVAQLLQQTGGQAGAEKIVRGLYDMPLNDFRALVLRPMMEREALLRQIMKDPAVEASAKAKQKAAEVLKIALSSSTDFEALAKQYTDDESSVNTGGDLGWISKGQLDPSWEPLIFSAATGTVVSTTVSSAYGYHVIKVEQKVTDKATSAASVKLRHILIKVDVDQYIKSLLSSAKIAEYAR